MGEIRVGCSGWVYRDWRGVLYPPGLPQRAWLERYAEVFDTVEVNSTFYRLARPGAAENWIAQTPPDFTFTCKASRYLTHMKRLQDMGQGVERFYAALDPLPRTDRMGPVLWQLPPNFGKDLARLERALAELPPGRHVFELRHPSWFADDEALDLLRDAGVGLAIGEREQVDAFQPWTTTADVALVRLHYGRRGRRGNYSDAELADLAPRIAALARDADVFVYLNNDWEGFAVRNARKLQRLLGVR